MAAVIWCAAIAAVPYALRPGHAEARINVAPPSITAPAPGPRVFNPRGGTARTPRPGWNITDQFDFDLASSLSANFNARNRIDNLSVDSGLNPIRWYLIFAALGERVAIAAPRYGVTHLIFPSPKTDKGRALAALFTRNGVNLGIDSRNGKEIWSVPHRDWAAFPPELIFVPDRDRAMMELMPIIEAGRETAVIETNEILPSAPGRVLSLSRDLERIEISAETDADSTLVVNDAYWPGWRALIDGVETPIFPADVLVRAVRWPAGRHTLVMHYEPPEVRVGIWLSVSGLVLLTCVCLILYVRKSKV